MISILMSIREEHNKNIEAGLKLAELRTVVPKISTPFRVYTYESGKNGRRKVVNTWICDGIYRWNVSAGVPGQLIDMACVPASYIQEYSNNGEKLIHALHISNLEIFDKPLDISNFCTTDTDAVVSCPNRQQVYCDMYCDTGYLKAGFVCEERDDWCIKCKKNPIVRPPQNWCYATLRTNN